jgi:glucuronate isomerase
MAFIRDDFLLQSEAARRLYRTYASCQPILDYHCHLPAADIATNRRFANLYEIWLHGDHYKWRAMRANGIAERYCTGGAPPYEKFRAWAATVPRCLRNPLYHWTHLELKRHFEIDDLLDERTADAVWHAANEQLAEGDLTTHGILRRFDVRAVGTTDDPADSLESHERIRASGLATRVYPTFRPDRAFDVHRPDVFNAWADRLAAAAGVDIVSLGDFTDALWRRHGQFHEIGCRMSDHGVSRLSAEAASEADAAAIFDRARAGADVPLDGQLRFAAHLLDTFARMNAARGWTLQLHLGPRRNASTRALRLLGPDTGFDSVGDWAHADGLGAWLDRLDEQSQLPQTIVYNVNPADNYVIATLLGSFQDGSRPGKLQFGSAWWFLDQHEGMEWQLNALSQTGLLAHFIGMTTDSRSFLSYPRHEYFRRVLCNLIGRDIEAGLLPDRDDLLGPLIEGICYANARRYTGY